MKLNTINEEPLDPTNANALNSIIDRLTQVKNTNNLRYGYNPSHNLDKISYHTQVIYNKIAPTTTPNAANTNQNTAHDPYTYIENLTTTYPQITPYLKTLLRTPIYITHPNLQIQQLTKANLAKLTNPTQQQLFTKNIQDNLPHYETATALCKTLNKHLEPQRAELYNYDINYTYKWLTPLYTQLAIDTLDYNGTIYNFKSRAKNPLTPTNTTLTATIAPNRANHFQLTDTTLQEIIHTLQKIDIAKTATQALQLPEITCQPIGNGIQITIPANTNNYHYNYHSTIKTQQDITFTSNDYKTPQDLYQKLTKILRHQN